MGICIMSEEESSYEESSEWITEEEKTRGLGDLLAAVGIGGKPGEVAQPLLDENGNPVAPVYQDGQYQVPTLTDKDGNVVHGGEEKQGMSTGTKVAIAGAGLAGLAAAGVAAAG